MIEPAEPQDATVDRHAAADTDPRLDETMTLIGSDKVEGTSVRRPDGERIGTVRRLMIDKVSGQVAYVVMSFGGFFTIGENFFPIPWERLRFDAALDAYMLDVSEESLRGAPQFPDEAAYDWSRAEGRRVDDFYGVPTQGD